jgi:lactate permease
LLVPFALLLMIDGRRGLRQAWPAALTAGLGFGIGQYLCSNFFTYQLTDLAAAVFGAGAIIVLLRLWAPAQSPNLDANLDAAPSRSAKRSAALSVAGDAVLADPKDQPISLAAGGGRDRVAPERPDHLAGSGHRDSRRELPLS